MQLNPHLNFISSVILFGVLQACVLSILFLKKGSNPGYPFLGFMLVVLAIIETESFLNYSGFVMYVPHLINVSPPLIFLLGPLAFLYVRKILGHVDNKKTLLLHFIPAIVYFSYSFFFYLQPAGFKLHAFMISHYPGYLSIPVAKIFRTDPLHIQGLIVIEGLAVHLLTYISISLWMIYSHKPSDEQLGQKNFNDTVRWIRFLCFNLLGGSIIFLLTGGVINGYVLFKQLLPSYMVDVYSMFLVYSISTYLLSRVTSTDRVIRKYSKSEIPTELRRRKIEEIKDIIELEKPYKEPDFSLDWLAKRTSMTHHHSSQVINTEMRMTFVEFINLCRINEAQKILKAPERRDVKVELLAYELGYQSKSAFFNAFKRHTSMTPARYRESK